MTTKEIDPAELLRKFDAQHGEVKALFEAVGAKMTAFGGKQDGFNGRITEIEQTLARRRGGGDGDHTYETPGARAIATEEYKALAGGRQRGKFALQVKTILSSATSGGALVPPDFRPDPLLMPRRMLTIRNLLGSAATTSNAVSYPRQTVRDLNAGVQTEGDSKPESNISFELQDAPVRTIAHWTRASKQVISDAPQLQNVIDSELRYGLQLAEEDEILLGDGSGQHIFGIIPQATDYETSRNVSGDTRFDVIAHAIAQAQVALLPATGIVLNDDDLENLKVIKDSEGRYIGGGPFGPPITSIWGRPVVGTPAMTAGDFLVGAFRDGATIYDRLDAEVIVSTEDADNLTKNLVTVLAEERLALAVRRPQAFIYGEFGVIT